MPFPPPTQPTDSWSLAERHSRYCTQPGTLGVMRLNVLLVAGSNLVGDGCIFLLFVFVFTFTRACDCVSTIPELTGSVSQTENCKAECSPGTASIASCHCPTRDLTTNKSTFSTLTAAQIRVHHALTSTNFQLLSIG